MKVENNLLKNFEWKNFCKVLEFYRLSLNLSKNKLALSLGVTPTIVGYWEEGRKEPKISNFVKLTQVLGVSESEFLHPTDEVKEKMKEMKLI
ncbi:MAG: helix-turn-helix transcriptional regulator [Synergistaceae bacterium]|nr:helix-turn-helix transcriptional regulator [Synergistaceae bacterium]